MVALVYQLSFAAGLIVAGFGALRYYGRRVADPYEASTRGEVVESTVDPEVGAGGISETYDPTVRYRYEVDGTEFVNDEVRAGGGRLSRRGARTLLSYYEAGTSVEVHYDPDAPQQSVLVDPGSGRAWLVLVLAGLAVAAAAGVLALG